MAAAAIPEFDSSYFFHQLARANRGVLVLDYDATVARFTASRRFPFPTLHELLDAILHTTHTRLVLLSKHPHPELACLLGLRPNPEIWTTDGCDTLLSENLLEELCDRGPVVYVTAENQPSRGVTVRPLFFLNKAQSWTGAPEDLVQFLIDWLRACGGEAC